MTFGPIRKTGPSDLEYPPGRPSGALKTTGEPSWSVSRLLAQVELVLARGFVGSVTVEGEVVGLRAPTSRASPGHLHFSLRDSSLIGAEPTTSPSSIACVMFAADARRTGPIVREGAKIRVQAQVNVYRERGRLQLRVTHAVDVGLGAALLAREALRQKLQEEGLFAAERKKALPIHPNVVGVVTSVDGAVLSDIVKVARARGRVRILVANTAVQGPDAPAQIAAAISQLSRILTVGVIIVGRGGGSVEDLAAFDSEVVVRAIAACLKPIVAAVGHESDWSLACDAADVRAATPSQAAELVVPERRALIQRLDHSFDRLRAANAARLMVGRATLDRLRASLLRPDHAIVVRRTRVGAHLERLGKAIRETIRNQHRRLENLRSRLFARDPGRVLAGISERLALLESRLVAAIRTKIALEGSNVQNTLNRANLPLSYAISRGESELARLAQSLHALSPLAVLGRGYAIAMKRHPPPVNSLHEQPSIQVLRSVSDTRPGELLVLRLNDGEILVRVE